MYDWKETGRPHPMPNKNCFYDERTGRYYCMGYRPTPKEYRQFRPYDTQFYTIMSSRYTNRITVQFKKQAIEDSSIEMLLVNFDSITGEFINLQYRESNTHIPHTTTSKKHASDILKQAGVDKYFDGIIAKIKELAGITIEDIRKSKEEPGTNKPDIEEEPPHEDEDYWIIHPVSPEPEIETDEGGSKSEKFNWMVIGIAVIGLILLIRR